MKNKSHQQKHIPVLVEEVLRYLDPKKGESYLDLTAGYGGHAGAVLERTLQPKKATLVDRDEQAVAELESKFGNSGARIVKSDFLSASQELADGEERFDIILADLGISSVHVDDSGRGFSFRTQAPLDMRMDRGQELTAADIVNGYSQEKLANLIYEYGEERRSRQIAQAIVKARPVETTTQLAEVVAAATGGRRGKTHPATRTFQALRIAVNDEIGQLKQALPLWLELLEAGGRLAVISFHSLEDQIVKQAFKSVSGDRYDADFRLLTKKPVVPDKNELVFNPRSRSAKLRVVAKIKN